MKKTDFKPVDRIVGEYLDLMRLRVAGPADSLEEVKRQLTVKDKSVEWEISRLKKRLREPYVNSNYVLAASIRQEIQDLGKTLNIYHYAELADGLYIPPGAWWLCEKIKDNWHKAPHTSLASLPEAYGKALRPYQSDIVAKLLAYKRATIVAATGLGKTAISAQIAWHFVQQGKKVLIVEPTITLLDQISEDIVKCGMSVSKVGNKNVPDASKDVLVSTVQSAIQVADIAHVILLDEAHHSSASTYEEVLLGASQAEHVYGLTACNVRLDGNTIGVHLYCGPVVAEYDTKWGIDNGFLSLADITMVDIKATPFVPDSKMAAVAYGKLCKHPATLQAIYTILEQNLKAGRRPLVIFKTVKAGKDFREYAKAKGLDFNVASAEYRKPLQDFRKGLVPFLVSNTGLLAEGVDVPGIDCIISVAMVSSENMTRQIIGRGLRMSKGKKNLQFYDLTTYGYSQFVRAREKRVKIYEEFANKISTIEVK